MPRPRPRFSLRIGNASITIYNLEDLKHIDDIMKTIRRYSNITTATGNNPKETPPSEEMLYVRERLSGIETTLEKVISQIEAIDKRLRALESIVSEKLIGVKEERSSSFVTADKLANNNQEEERNFRPATEKQKRYLWNLLKRTGVTIDEIREKFGIDIAREEDKLDIEKASEIITYLQKIEKGEEEEEDLDKLEPADKELIKEVERLAIKAGKFWNMTKEEAILQACLATTNSEKTSLEEMTREEVERVIEWFRERLK